MSRVCIPDYVGYQIVEGARALSRNGDHVTLATWKAGTFQSLFKSNCISELIPIVDPRHNIEKYTEDVSNLCRDNKFDVLMPFGLNAIQALVKSKHRHDYESRAMLPQSEIFDLLNNKDTLESFASEIGISTPLTFRVTDKEMLRDIDSRSIYPLVMKLTNYSGVFGGLRYANSLSELQQAWDKLVGQADEKSESVIVQEFVPGKIHDVCTLSVHGQPVRLLSQIRELMYPIYGGVGAVNITTDNKILCKLAEKLIVESGYHGPAQIEFKRDIRTGEYKLIEFNPKLWGTLPLSISAGVNFPKLIRDYVMGDNLNSQKDYTIGLRQNFWIPLAFLAKIQLFKEFGFSQPKWETPYSKVRNDIDWRDIKPDLYRIASTFMTLLKGRMIDVNSNLPKELIPVPWKNNKY